MEVTRSLQAAANASWVLAWETDTSKTPCAFIGINWRTGGRKCVSAQEIVFLAALIIGVLVVGAMIWASLARCSSDEASRRAIYGSERDSPQTVAERLGWPCQRRKDESDERTGESRSLLHDDPETSCDYCTWIEQGRAGRSTECGCDV